MLLVIWDQNYRKTSCRAFSGISASLQRALVTGYGFSKWGRCQLINLLEILLYYLLRVIPVK